MTDKKYHLWATGDSGEGRVLLVGTYNDIEEMSIPINIFGRDVVFTITFEVEK